MAKITQLFLSCVTAEFRSYREILRHNLQQPNLTVQIQEDFIAAGEPTLEKLDTYVKSCDAVIHLAGGGLGSLAKPRSIAYLRDTYPELPQRFPELDPFLDASRPSLSYTQWEAWLALLHNRKLLICTPAANTLHEQEFTASQEEQDRQNEHLERLRRFEAYPEIYFSNADNLTWKIQQTINTYFIASAASPEIELAQEQSAKPAVIPPLETISIMVLVEDSGESGLHGVRYQLRVELHPENILNDELIDASSLEPQENVCLDSRASDAIYIGDCLKQWLTTCRSLAQRLAATHGWPETPELLLEVFLPADLLLLDCGGVMISSATRPRPLAKNCCYVVRSLERARDQINSRATLEDKQQGTDIMIITEGPPESLQSDAEAWAAWHDALYDQASNPNTLACIYLPDPVEDITLRRHLFEALVDACVPLAMFWPGGERSTSLPRQDRLAILQKLLGIDSGALPLESENGSHAIQALGRDPQRLTLNHVASTRRDLIHNHPSSCQAVVVMETPDHWPRSLASQHPSDQLRSPL